MGRNRPWATWLATADLHQSRSEGTNAHQGKRLTSEIRRALHSKMQIFGDASSSWKDDYPTASDQRYATNS